MKEPRSLRALYGITRAMDRNEELKKVRPYLINIIKKYKSIMNASDVPQDLEKTAAEKAILRIRSLGWYLFPTFRCSHERNNAND